jgi:hypothetical protein
MAAIESGIGATGFIVFDERTDAVAVAHGVSRFLAVESCGQCTPCKHDGIAIADLVDGIRRSRATDDDLAAVEDRLRTVTDEARCYLATQHQLVLTSIMRLFPNAFTRHISRALDEAEPYVIAPIVDIVDGEAVLDERQPAKQPDWSYEDSWSGSTPVELASSAAHT